MWACDVKRKFREIDREGLAIDNPSTLHPCTCIPLPLFSSSLASWPFCNSTAVEQSIINGHMLISIQNQNKSFGMIYFISSQVRFYLSRSFPLHFEHFLLDSHLQTVSSSSRSLQLTNSAGWLFVTLFA